ncbi:MAG: hypothetical protein JNK05_24730 [Myxococcales bacterium]|nr:hypothetical protein [Myxococcales bacterium]
MTAIEPIAFDGVTDTAHFIDLDDHPERPMIEALVEAQEMKVAPVGKRRGTLTVYRDERSADAARGVRSDTHSSAEQLLRRCGARWTQDERLRAIAEHRAWRVEWPFDAVRASLILCACPDEHVPSSIDAFASDRAKHRFSAPRRWIQRAFDGEREPRLAAANILHASRRRPDAWARAFRASRERFAQSIDLQFHLDKKNGELLRAALEMIDPDSIDGLTITASDGADIGQLALSMPEGLQSLSVFCALDGAAQKSFAASSALRSVRRLVYFVRDAELASMISGAAFESIEELSVASYATPMESICNERVLGRFSALRSFALRSSSISDDDLEAISASVSPGSLRVLAMRIDGLSARGRTMLATHDAFSSLESLTIAEGYTQQEGAPSALYTIAVEGRFTRLEHLALPRFGFPPATSATSIVAASTSEATRNLRSLKLFNVDASALEALSRAQRGPALEVLELEANEEQWTRAANPFTGAWTRALRLLTVWGASDTQRLCEALAASNMNALIGLAINTGSANAAAIETLARAPFASNLRVLSLMGCKINEGTARALCEAPWTSSIDRLIVDASKLTDDEQWLLRVTFGPALLLVR